MRIKLAIIFGLSVLASGALADDASSIQILNRHVAAMKAGDLKTVMADYADDAVAITPHGVAPAQKAAGGIDVFSGKQNVLKLFSVLTDKDHVPSNKTMESRYEPRSDGVILMHWEQNKGRPEHVSGVDVFVIRGGKIAFQDVTINSSSH